MIQNLEEAAGILETSKMTYSEGEYSLALSMLSEVAAYVNRTSTREAIPEEQLKPFALEVYREVCRYQNCESECAWERSAGIRDLFLGWTFY